MSTQDVEHMKKSIQAVLDKLKASSDFGPGGDPAVLESDESMLVYRLLTEQLRLQHTPSEKPSVPGMGR